MGTPITITPMAGGKLMTNISSERAGALNYATKRDFRRELDLEVRREGYDYFWPFPSHLIGSQPFPQNQGESTLREPITLVHEAVRADNERAVVVGTETTLFVLFPFRKQSYANYSGSPDDEYLGPAIVPYVNPGYPSTDIVPGEPNYPPEIDNTTPVNPGGGTGGGTPGGGTVPSDPSGGGGTGGTPPTEHKPSDDYPEGTILPPTGTLDPTKEYITDEVWAGGSDSYILGDWNSWAEIPIEYRKYAMGLLATEITTQISNRQAEGWTCVGILDPVASYTWHLAGILVRNLGAEAPQPDGSPSMTPVFKSYGTVGWSVKCVLQFQML
jgi:hypothetical protein